MQAISMNKKILNFILTSFRNHHINKIQVLQETPIKEINNNLAIILLFQTTQLHKPYENSIHKTHLFFVSTIKRFKPHQRNTTSCLLKTFYIFAEFWLSLCYFRESDFYRCPFYIKKVTRKNPSKTAFLGSIQNATRIVLEVS